jgi:hypothetical protein
VLLITLLQDNNSPGVAELITQLLILANILWLPLCWINKFGLNTLPSKTIAIPYTCGLSLTDTCPTVVFQTHAVAWLGLQEKLTPSTLKGDFLSMSSQGRTRIVIEHASGQLSSITSTPLYSAVVPMTQWKKMKPM